LAFRQTGCDPNPQPIGECNDHRYIPVLQRNWLSDCRQDYTGCALIQRNHGKIMTSTTQDWGESNGRLPKARGDRRKNIDANRQQHQRRLAMRMIIRVVLVCDQAAHSRS
jgi:hypothetical protein